MGAQLQYQSLPDQIVAKLTDEILKGVYMPGERLKEQELALKMGTSRAPLREAFRVLERNGLIEILPWRGVRIVEPTRNEIKELFEARADMFGLCARHVALTAEQAQLVKIEAAIDELIRSTDADCDEREYKNLTNEIGSLMYGMIQNRYTREYIESLRQKMFWHYCYMGISSHAIRQNSNEYWRELGKALLARDAQSAEAAAQRIIAMSRNFALQLLDEKVDVASDTDFSKSVQPAGAA